MIVSRKIKEILASTPTGIVLTTKDFGIEMRYQPALVKALSRLVKLGTLQKISKGKYYIPKKTIFGTLKPTDTELIKEFLEKDGNIIGYITGTSAFASMGLTTQISASTLIGTNKNKRTTFRAGKKISFLLQENPITSDNIPLLRILDALRMINKIPATSPDECISKICNIIKNLSTDRQDLLLNLSINYTPFVRALLGAIYETIGLNTYKIFQSLNGATKYKIPITDTILTNKKNWNII